MKEAIICQAFSRIYGPLSLVKPACTDAYQMRGTRQGKLQLSVINSNISLFHFFSPDNYNYDNCSGKSVPGLSFNLIFSGFSYISAVGELYHCYKMHIYLYMHNPSSEKWLWIFANLPEWSDLSGPLRQKTVWECNCSEGHHEGVVVRVLLSEAHLLLYYNNKRFCNWVEHPWVT